jgi:hypothetical protein
MYKKLPILTLYEFTTSQKLGFCKPYAFKRFFSPNILDILFAIQKSLSKMTTSATAIKIQGVATIYQYCTYQQNINLSGDLVPLNQLACICNFNAK